MTSRRREKAKQRTSRRDSSATKAGRFMSYVEWLMWEATVGPSILHPPQEQESNSDEELLQQVQNFSREEEEEDEVMEEIERY